MDALLGALQAPVIVLVSIAPFIVVIAGVLTLRRRRTAVRRTANVFMSASAAGVFPHSLRPPPDIPLAHEDTPVVDEMPPEKLRRLRDTGDVRLPD